MIGIRIAMLVVAFASFGSSTLFSLLIINHNRMVVSMNDDLNRRAELFRELQFNASNYSVIEFMDRMIIYPESLRYIERYIHTKSYMFHLFEASISAEDVNKNPERYNFYSFKIPYKVLEGKLVSKITLSQVYFETLDTRYVFLPDTSSKEARAYLLYNEKTHRNNIIINLVVSNSTPFFNPHSINVFSKFKMNIRITSLLGVSIKGMSELYFTNPEKLEGDLTNTYKINASNFVISGMPYLENKNL